MSYIKSTNTTHWMKKGMIIWSSEPDKPTELRKVVRVINKTNVELRPLRFYEKWFHDIWKWYSLNIRNPVMRWLYQNNIYRGKED